MQQLLSGNFIRSIAKSFLFFSFMTTSFTELAFPLMQQKKEVQRTH